VRLVRETLESGLGEHWVAGEISNARRAPSNHFYFTLKDAQCAVNVVMFRGAYGRLRFEPRDGMEVLVRGRVSVFETRGALQLYADELEPRGVGALQIAFEQLKQRLAAEGLFDRARKRPLPYMPRTVGIVTARRGAGLRDMMAVMLDRFPGLQVIVRPAKVQGDGAAREIAEAIADLNRDGRADVLIVGRGGGSLEDLWAFNEEAVARAIAGSAIPVISAVGHEIDYTIADLVADARAPTPTAAAHLVVPSKAELSERVASLGAALAAALERELAGLRETIAHLTRRVRHPRHLIVNSRQRLDDAAQALATAASRRVGDARRRLRELARGVAAPSAALREARLVLHHGAAALRAQVAARVERAGKELGALAGRLDSLSPLRVLERGYAVVVNRRDGRAVLDASTVSLGDELDVRVARGRLAARTTAREV
jgi:exodeoxyribonuclease VII large subunit